MHRMGTGTIDSIRVGKESQAYPREGRDAVNMISLDALGHSPKPRMHQVHSHEEYPSTRKIFMVGVFRTTTLCVASGVAAWSEESHKAITHIASNYLPQWAVGVLNELMGWSEDLYLFPDRLIAVANWAD
jgi:hypothetical protein